MSYASLEVRQLMLEGAEPHASMWKKPIYCADPRVFPTQIREEVTCVLQQHKEGNGEERSGTFHFIAKKFYPHATDLDFFFFPCVGLHFPNYSSYDKQGSLNWITCQQLHLIP